MDEFNASIEHLTRRALGSADRLSLTESHLVEDRVKKAMLPTEAPMRESRLGSGFGWHIDPLSGQRALHTGLASLLIYASTSLPQSGAWWWRKSSTQPTAMRWKLTIAKNCSHDEPTLCVCW